MILLRLQDIGWLSISPNQVEITTQGSDEYDWKSTLKGRMVQPRDLKRLSLKKQDQPIQKRRLQSQLIINGDSHV